MGCICWLSLITFTKGFTHSSTFIFTPDKYKSDSTPVRIGIGYSILHESFMKTSLLPLSRQPPSPRSLWSPPCANNYQYLLNVSHKALSCAESLPRIRQRRTRGAALMRCPQRCACTCAKGSRCSNPLPGDLVHWISSATWGQTKARPPAPERHPKSYFTMHCNYLHSQLSISPSQDSPPHAALEY